MCLSFCRGEWGSLYDVTSCLAASLVPACTLYAQVACWAQLLHTLRIDQDIDDNVHF